jgi:hypothetical protein
VQGLPDLGPAPGLSSMPGVEVSAVYDRYIYGRLWSPSPSLWAYRASLLALTGRVRAQDAGPLRC